VHPDRRTKTDIAAVARPERSDNGAARRYAVAHHHRHNEHRPPSHAAEHLARARTGPVQHRHVHFRKTFAADQRRGVAGKTILSRLVGGPVADKNDGCIGKRPSRRFSDWFPPTG
jgi:hypothetical protein